MLEHDLQLRQPGAQRDHHAVDEDGLTVEDIHVRIRDLTVHQQRHAGFGHGFQHRNHPINGAHARIGIGGGTRRVELDGRHHIPGSGLPDLVHRGLFGEIEGHERLEACRLGLADLAPPRGLIQRKADAVTIGRSLGHRGDGRAQVGHDDGAAKLACTGGHDRMEGSTVTQVQVPVVGGSESQRIHDAMICRHAVHRAMVDEAVRPNRLPPPMMASSRAYARGRNRRQAPGSSLPWTRRAVPQPWPVPSLLLTLPCPFAPSFLRTLLVPFPEPPCATAFLPCCLPPPC